jgi:hypothetical protein
VIVPKGKVVFSQREVDRIRTLISQTRNSNRPDQKRLRQQLRDMRFYISDFQQSSAGFTVSDFEDLIRLGRIKVTG